MFALNYQVNIYEETAFLHMQTKKIHDMLLTFHKTPHITLCNEQCLKLLLGVAALKRARSDLSLSLEGTIQIEKT